MFYRSWPSSSGSYTPLTYIRGFPVDATTLIVVAHIVAMVMSAIALTVLSDGNMLESYHTLIVWFGFDGLEAVRGKLWTIITYPFLHNIALSNIFFALDMLFFFLFGREVERYIGRNAYVWFYALLIVVPAVVVGLFSLLFGKTSLYGSSTLHFAVFIGFVTIYPNVQFIFGLVAKWLAWGFLSIYTLYHLVHHDWNGMLYLWVSCGLAYFLLKSAGVGGGFSWFEAMASWKEQRHEQQIRKRIEHYEREEAEKEQGVDSILDKISREGLNSLTQKEKNLLQRASRDLHQKDQ